LLGIANRGQLEAIGMLKFNELMRRRHAVGQLQFAIDRPQRNSIGNALPLRLMPSQQDPSTRENRRQQHEHIPRQVQADPERR
jgi:hypothetical protein